MGGVFISLESSSRSVFDAGEILVFSSMMSFLSIGSWRLGGGNGLIFLPKSAFNAEPGGAGVVVDVGAADDDDAVDASIESGDIVAVDACCFS